STVTRATLHNLDEIGRKGLLIGDHVILQKAGDVIPEVVRPIVEKRTGAERPFAMPERCPVCDTPIVRDEGAVRHSCPNPPWLAAEVPAGDEPPGAAWLRHAAAHLERVATDNPARFEEVEGIGPTVATALAAWFTAGGPGRAVIDDLADAGIEPELPAPRPAG